MFFDNWEGVARVLITGVGAYAALVIALRISGKRTLSKMNAFDLIVTVALGSTLATVIVSKDVPLVEGLAALALLIFLQFVVTWLSVRSATLAGAMKSEPALLFFEGQFLDRALQHERITQAEVESAIRQNGMASADEVAAVVLETDGSLSVVRSGAPGRQDALSSVRGT